MTYLALFERQVLSLRYCVRFHWESFGHHTQYVKRNNVDGGSHNSSSLTWYEDTPTETRTGTLRERATWGSEDIPIQFINAYHCSTEMKKLHVNEIDTSDFLTEFYTICDITLTQNCDYPFHML